MGLIEKLLDRFVQEVQEQVEEKGTDWDKALVEVLEKVVKGFDEEAWRKIDNYKAENEDEKICLEILRSYKIK